MDRYFTRVLYADEELRTTLCELLDIPSGEAGLPFRVSLEVLAPTQPGLTCEPVEPFEKMSPRDFVLAGKAVFTLTRPDGQHYTYRVNKAESPDLWFVSIGINYEESIYLGILGKGNRITPDFKLTKKSRFGASVPSVQCFTNWWEAVRDDRESSIRFQHEGKCCVCGRPLTNPESIDAGIGPECRGKLGYD